MFNSEEMNFTSEEHSSISEGINATNEEYYEYEHDNETDHCDSHHHYEVARAIAIPMYSLIFICGTILNVLVIITLTKHYRRVKNKATIFIINLSVSDLVYAGIVAPFIANYYYHRYWIFGRSMCHIISVLEHANIVVSLLSFVLISINRCFLVSCNNSYPTMYQRKYVIMMIISAWIIPYILLITLLFTAEQDKIEQHHTLCELSEAGKDRAFHVLIIFIAIPFILSIITYAVITYVFQSSQQQVRKYSQRSIRSNKSLKSNNSSNNVMANTQERKFAKLILAIFSTYVICYFPKFLDCFGALPKSCHDLSMMSQLLVFLSTCIHPIIYAILNKQYRKELKQLLPFKRRSNYNQIALSNLSSRRKPSISSNNSNNITNNSQNTSIHQL